jgi:RNA polymerase sigma-70 factor (ECF subfamily)
LPDEVRELLESCRRGDQRAIAELVERFRELVFGLCFRMLGHRQDAEDMAQESFVRAIRNLDRWDATREFRPWLLAIAGNRCRTLLSTRSRRPSTTSEVDHVPDRSPDPQAARNLVEEVELGLETLRGEYRQAFLLFHQQHLSYAEIAEVLDCPVGTAKTWVHRARRELAERLRRREIVQEHP